MTHGDALLRHPFLSIVGLVALVILAGAAAGSFASQVPARPVPRFGPAHLLTTGPAPSASIVYYLQEGVTLVTENQIPYPFPSLSANLTIESSPLATAYELNALSNSNDWYQAFVTDNWPGCSRGFAFGYEVWDQAGYSVIGPVCNIAANLSAADSVGIMLSLNCAAGGPGSACLDFADRTNGFRTLVTLVQPQTGGTAFLNLDTAAGIYGYFTGPMTEVVDTTSSACRWYGQLPTVGYVIDVDGLGVTSYIAWSDEFELTPLQAFGCYAYSSPVLTVGSSPVSDYLEATGGSVYGPHWEAGQDWSAVSGNPGQWRFQTDVNPLAFAIALSRASADVGQNVTLTGTTSGGAGSVSCRWSVGGIPRGGVTACTWVEVPSVPGTATITAYALDALSDYVAANASQVIYPDPVVSAPETARQTMDVGQNVSWSATVSGGSGGYLYNWSGLPAGCAGTQFVQNCTSMRAGIFDVKVNVTDSDGFTVVSPPSRLTVSLDPAVTVTVNPDSPLAGQFWALAVEIVGGLGPYVFEWYGLPPGCVPAGGAANVSCETASPGLYNMTVRVTDANRISAEAPAQVRVEPSFLGLPVVLGYGIVSGVVLAAVIGIIVVLLARRRKRRGPSLGGSPSVLKTTTEAVAKRPLH